MAASDPSLSAVSTLVAKIGVSGSCKHLQQASEFRKPQSERRRTKRVLQEISSGNFHRCSFQTEQSMELGAMKIRPPR